MLDNKINSIKDFNLIVNSLPRYETYEGEKFSTIKEKTLEHVKDNSKYVKRLEIELYEIEKSGMWDYFKELIKSNRKFHNDKSLLCAYLWGICPENPIEENKDLIWGFSFEMPDLDIDFEPHARNKIKEYCSKEFGENNVVSIVNYNHFGIKSGIRDIARVLEIPIDEVFFTTEMDDDVNNMPWEDSIEQYPKLAEFEKKYPEACGLIRDFNGRIRGMGKHAGGLVIANVDLTKTIPLVTRSNPDGERFILSSFAEGQNRSDLKTVGLVKQDILGLETLNYISTCLKILEKRGKYNPKKGLFKITPDSEEWTDESYLSDPDSIEVANNADLKLIFQFDSPGMRSLIEEGGVTCFEDLAAYSALFRPGPLGSGMSKEYIKRKNGTAEYSIHPIMEPIIGSTYGIVCYQEQLMQIMNKVGLISLQDCDDIRKAMGKKEFDRFMKYKQIFLENGQRTLGWKKLASRIKNPDYMKDSNTDEFIIRDKEDSIEGLWEQMITFARYGFNKCITPDSIVETKDKYKLAGNCKTGDIIKSYNPDKKEYFWDEVIQKHDNGIKDVFEIELDNGYTIECTINHEFLCENGEKRKLHEIINKKLKIITEVKKTFIALKIINIKPKGKKKVIDLEMKSKYHNFLANGIVIGNSHAVSYAILSARELYLKTHYQKEYYSAVLSHLKTGDKRIKIYIQDGRKKGLKFEPLDINKSKLGFEIIGDEICIGFDKVKGISKEAAKLVELQPFKSIDDYLERYGPGKKVGETLIKTGAFNKYEENMKVLLKYFEYRRENRQIEKGMNRIEFGRMYKLLMQVKSCPRPITDKFTKLIEEGKKKVSYENLIKNITRGEFEFIEIDKCSLLDYVDSKKDDFQKSVMDIYEFKDQEFVQVIEDFSDQQKSELENELYTFYFNHPLDAYARECELDLEELLRNKIMGRVEVIITDVERRTTKKGNPFYIITLEDEYENVRVLMWNNQYTMYRDLIYNGSAIRIDIQPSMYHTWNLTKMGEIIRMRKINEQTEAEEREERGNQEYRDLIKKLDKLN